MEKDNPYPVIKCARYKRAANETERNRKPYIRMGERPNIGNKHGAPWLASIDGTRYM